MTPLSNRPRIVVLGMMSRIPVPGVIWQTMHYLLGFERLGCDVWYVEDHGMTPTAFFDDSRGDGWEAAAAFVDRVMREFGLGGRWAYHAEHGGDRHFGMTATELRVLYGSAALLLNLHGATRPRPEHTAGGPLVLVETDPVELETQLAAADPVALEYAGAHSAFFTFGENVGRDECGLPATPGFDFVPTRQPVVLDLWDSLGLDTRAALTTIGNWRQHHRSVSLDGEVYHWSKHLEFSRFLDLPERTGQSFELALASCDDDDRALLAHNGWDTRRPFLTADSIEDYRRFIGSSYAEFTVAKDQNIRLRTGWFSDRSATYLAAGRPVVTQDTGFGSVLPTGKGLFAFSTADEAAAAVDEIRSNYPLHRRAAREISRECFSADVVLGAMLGSLGVSTRMASTASGRFSGLPTDLRIEPVSRHPLTLLDTTSALVEARLRTRIREAEARRPARVRRADPDVSVVIVVRNGARFTTMCLESLLADPKAPPLEVLVVDNGSRDQTAALLDAYQRLDARVRVISNDENLGFAAANNQGVAAARGEIVVLLNNDTIVTPGWLAPLVGALGVPDVGLVGPTTNRTCNEAQIDTDYSTIAELAQFAGARRTNHDGRRTDMKMLAMFCVAGRRTAFEEIGPLDERFEVGMFEDDDYARRLQAAGYRLVCAEDAFVHHFGQATIGTALSGDEYQHLFDRNRSRFEAKWNTTWRPHERRVTEEYTSLRARVRGVVEARVPAGAVVLVAAKGDDALLALTGRTGWHFPGRPDGSFLGEYPPDSSSAIEVLERSRQAGAMYLVFPAPSAWWLEHYAGLHAHLVATWGAPIVATSDLTMWSLVEPRETDGRVDSELTALRRIVVEQVDLLDRMRAEVATLRNVLISDADRAQQSSDDDESDPAPDAGLDVAASLRETWHVLDRALEEGGASKHTRYLLLCARLRAQVVALTSPGSTIGVVSRGDDDLIALPDRVAWHVPRLPDGSWSAGLPADGAEAVRDIEILRVFGADYLVLPATYAWWLDTYRDLAEHLETRSVALLADPEVGFVWDLRADANADGSCSLDSVVTTARRHLAGDEPTLLDWNTPFELAARFPELAVFSPPEPTSVLPYLDGTVDIVAVGPCSRAEVEEATRVAAVAVVHVPATGIRLRGRVTWMSDVSHTGPTVSIVAPSSATSAAAVDAIVRSLPALFAGEVLVPGYDVDGHTSVDPVRRVPPETDEATWARVAATSTDADIVVFVDPALVPLRGWIDAIVTRLGAAAAIGAVTGAVVAPSAGGSGAGAAPEPTLAVLAVRASVLEAVGGLPPADTVANACAALADSVRDAGHRVIHDADVLMVRADALDAR
jgi:GT2 family glycosyltransferase